MNKIALWSSSFFSCVIVVFMMFQFWNEKYKKKYPAKHLYKILAALYVAAAMSANTLMIPLFNLSVNVIMIAGISFCFYEGKNTGRFMRVFESAAFFTVLSITEAVGVYLIDLLMDVMGVMPEDPQILRSIEYTFSKAVMLFLYYVLFVRLWRRRLVRTASQYFLYIAMFFYSMVNILATASISDEEHPDLLMIVMGSIVFSNMFLLYFMKYLDERNFYKLQNDMMRQQEKLRLENYEIQRDTYTKALSVLHDVKKHISVIETLYRENREEALDYTKQINEMLKPLMPMRYVDHPILNCLLTDKSRTADQHHIQFEIDVSTGDVNFMESIDVTTLFGNLLDNALEAAGKCRGEKYVGLCMKRWNDMLFVRAENSIDEPVPIRSGMIAAPKKGIGILNMEKCVDSYGGTIDYKSTEDRIVCEIRLNIEE